MLFNYINKTLQDAGSMKKRIGNIVFTKNRPLQLDAYLHSLYRSLPSQLIQTYIIYKVELFEQEYESLFRKYPDCVVVKESDFHNDFLEILNRIDTKYILFGIDDVVFFDSVDFDIIEQTFAQYSDDIMGFTLRFSPESLKDSNDIITNVDIGGQKVYRLNWKQGQTPQTRYPFELCCTIYPAELVKKIISGTMNNNPAIKKIFPPNTPLIKALRATKFARKILKAFGYFFSPNTLESWNCRWCQRNPDQLPGHLYFQKLCASAVQVNMVNTTTKYSFDGEDDLTVETLNEKYKQGYRFDVDFVVKNKPVETHGEQEYFKLIRR